ARRRRLRTPTPALPTRDESLSSGTRPREALWDAKHYRLSPSGNRTAPSNFRSTRSLKRSATSEAAMPAATSSSPSGSREGGKHKARFWRSHVRLGQRSGMSPEPVGGTRQPTRRRETALG